MLLLGSFGGVPLATENPQVIKRVLTWPQVLILERKMKWFSTLIQCEGMGILRDPLEQPNLPTAVPLLRLTIVLCQRP